MTRPATTLLPPRPPTSFATVDGALADLQSGAGRWRGSSLLERIELARASVAATAATATAWVEVACLAKRIARDSPARAEEVLVGPVSLVRYLQLMIRTLRDLRAGDAPRLPGEPRVVRGQLRVPTFPTRQLYDALLFRGMRAETWLERDANPQALFGASPARLSRRSDAAPRICLVLGAGNVSAIPATDALTYLLQNDCAVLLKMNPVNEYLGPCFEQALAPFVRAGVLRIVYGGADVGRYAMEHRLVDVVHLTGSTDTHDAIVWGASADERAQRQAAGEPRLTKPVTSELGNVTPWLIVPGAYRPSQLQAQAESIAASIANNASFNCIATKMLVTWKGWPERERFLDLVAATLARIPPRYAYYPGAAERFTEFSGGAGGLDDAGRLPWVLRRDVRADREPCLFRRESFVCVAGETALEAASPEDFLERGVEFLNEQLWGTLAAGVTVPDDLSRDVDGRLDAALERLRYGTIGVNQWPGVAYALMSPPWGAYPGAGLDAVQSGQGYVHNTYLLDRPQKTVLTAPLQLWPKPMWFSTHRCPERVAWNLLRLYCRPALRRLPQVLLAALRG